jgi:ABC-type glycerol-3-phosphate transport system substrate-binding protein
MSPSIRNAVIGAVTLAGMLAGSIAPAQHAAAATPVVLTVTYAYPFADPTVAANLKTNAGKYTQAIVNGFEKLYPGVTIKWLNWGWSDLLRQKFLLNVAAGNAPDVITGETDFPDYARQGILLPVNLGPLQAQMVPGSLSVGEYNGVPYAVPVQTGIFELYYNKTLFKQAGLDPSKPPTTWDQWLADSKKIQALGHGISGTASEINTGLGTTFRMIPFLRQEGGDLTAADGVTPTFDTPANIKAFTFLRELAATQSPAISATVDEGKFYADAWYAGKAGFTVNGPWDIPNCTTYKIDCGIALLPTPTGGHAGDVVVGNLMFGVPKLAKHPALALDFVRYFAQASVSDLNWKYNGELPSNTTELSSLLANKSNLNPLVVPFMQGLSLGKISGLPVFAENNSNIYSAIYDMQLAVGTTQQPIDQILKTLQTNVEAQLAQ